MLKRSLLVARTRIWETMPDGHPIVRWMNPAGYFIPHLSTKRNMGSDTKRYKTANRFGRNYPDPKRENPQVRMLGYWLDDLIGAKGT
jgi:hypothetical protein